MAERIYIVEDHLALRGALRDLIEKTNGLSCCGTSQNAEGALEELTDSRAEAVVVDVSLPGMSGIELVRELRKREITLPCLMLTGHRSDIYAEQARKAGAQGFVTKDAMHELVPALKQVLAGELYFPEI